MNEKAAGPVRDRPPGSSLCVSGYGSPTVTDQREVSLVSKPSRKGIESPTVRVTGTSTSRSSGSLLSMHRKPSYVPPARPVESKVTSTVVVWLGGVVP